MTRDFHHYHTEKLQVTDVADASTLRRLFTELLGRGDVVMDTSNSLPHDHYLNGI